MDAAGNRIQQRSVLHTAGAVEEAITWALRESGAATTAIAVALEVPRGALVDAFLDHGLAVFTINPKQVDRFRDRFTVAGAKDDRRDALVLAAALRTDVRAFRRVTGEHAVIVQIRQWSRMAEELAEELRSLTNRVREQVYRVAPGLLALCPAADEPWFWALVAAAPTPTAQRRVGRQRIGTLLRRHRIRRLTVDQVYAALQAPPFPLAPGVEDAAAAHLRLLLARVRLVHQQRGQCERELVGLLDTWGAEAPPASDQREHHDVAILQSCPGVGTHVTAVMLAEASRPLADRDYATLRAEAGVAPITQQSGKRCLVTFRWACNKRLRNAVYYWAQSSLRDPGCRAYYDRLRRRGHAHARALRSLGDRLLRILIALLNTGSLYDPSRYAAAQSVTATVVA
jgi:transposase